MFTGIVEETGYLRQINRQGQALVLTIQAQKVLEQLHIGDSIAVNGVCLTVTHFDQHHFVVDCVPETYRKTNLKHLNPGSAVNLERAMKGDSRFGGHIVQGHVDTTAQILSKTMEENAVVFRIQPRQLEKMKYIIPTGSITVDGISLTVVQVTDKWFSLYMIPHTLSHTVLIHKQMGDEVNLECDVISKYVEKLLQYDMNVSANSLSYSKHNSVLTEQFLSDNGFKS
jgi:riboflavin synthase